MVKPSPFFLILLGFGFFFATYNLVTLVIHNQNTDLAAELGDALSFSRRSDPVSQRLNESKESEGQRRRFHVALTATDSPYSKWQCRIMYYWYKKMKDLEGSEMGSFTRVLHSGSPDNLMEEIPTFVVDPLPAGVDQGYVVLNRPWAFIQWLEKAKIKEEYILMAEPDHIFVKPLPNLSRGDQPAAFPFFYIKPSENEKIIRKFYPEEKGPVTDIDPIGNSPVIIKKPPWDLKTTNSFIIHYTYGCDYSLKGELTYGRIGEWRFDKRSYIRGPPPRNLPLPPPRVPESVVTLVKMVNEATANIPDWEEGR
ncbi:hydroxyproline O-arabinosyltransferase 3-like isoform X2 [Phalaenopsis equestris]|uniref:hydroxyproline O-arabinosyltransferase 3-like isoform X2 n=1 Tax=Phalaenopsis equestris TaxID=78828 RepID=UPI0009E24311|nr:hydroxyproline O-arabinosyltransferase 3-like isoform X2 [Phalaenopsis equestris]